MQKAVWKGPADSTFLGHYPKVGERRRRYAHEQECAHR